MSKQWEGFYTEVDYVQPLNLKLDKNTECGKMTTRGIIDNASEVHTDETLSNWVSYSYGDIARHQSQDFNLLYLHEWADSNSVPIRDEVAALNPEVRKYWLNWENITRKNGILYQKRVSANEMIGVREQLLVLLSLRREVLLSCHNSLLSAHVRMNKTISKIKQRFLC